MIDRPIPAAYYVYGLRSSSGRARPYVGSTPHPPRRLAQHNGLIVGGASKTSRGGRPWDMMFVVSGFTSKIAALQFEWALGNYHLTNFIPTGSRLVPHIWVRNRRGTKKAHMPPNQKSKQLFENLHLLLRVHGFSRWPLAVQFLRKDCFAEWQRVTKDITPEINPQRPVFLSPVCEIETTNDDTAETQNGKPPGRLKSNDIPLAIRSLDLTYDTIKPQLLKSLRILECKDLTCQVCRNELNVTTDQVLVCPQHGCDMTSHMTCLSSAFLTAEDQEDEIIPMNGSCPRCRETVSWSQMIKDLSLRLRGRTEIERLQKEPKKKSTAASGLGSDVSHHPELPPQFLDAEEDDDGHMIYVPEENLMVDDDECDFEDIDALSIDNEHSHKLPKLRPISPQQAKDYSAYTEIKEIPDSDWDDIEQILD